MRKVGRNDVKMFPKGHKHGQSADRDARHKQAAVHPNEDDFKVAQDFAQHILAKERMNRSIPWVLLLSYYI